MIILVTGGAGFLGSAIVEELLSSNSADEIRILDIKKPKSHFQNEVLFFHGDILDKKLVREACEGVDVVIHSAAIIDWGTRTKNEVLNINVGGTKQVIEACLDQNVKGLVYTSSLDAVFTGKPLRDIDESVDYPSKPGNAYCQSKQEAELIVRKANGSTLKTCVLRPADIYGEDDPYHIGSLVKMAENKFYVRLGNGKSICQHVYVKNMAHAHVLVANALLDQDSRVSGNVYFITDGPGENFFKFYDQIVIGAGYEIWPRNLWIPKWIAYVMGSLAEGFAKLISPFVKTNPKFSRFAVVYTCTDFTFSSDKAREDFNYRPKYPLEEALRSTIKFYSKPS